MKKVVILMIATIALVLCSCSDNDENTNAPKKSQFIYADDSLVISINGNRNFGITIFKNGEGVYQNIHQVKISGEYPKYTYTYTEDYYEDIQLQLTCSYSNPSNFTATVTINNIIAENISPSYKGQTIILPKTMAFYEDNKVLDTNGDFLLDDKYFPHAN